MPDRREQRRSAHSASRDDFGGVAIGLAREANNMRRDRGEVDDEDDNDREAQGGQNDRPLARSAAEDRRRTACEEDECSDQEEAQVPWNDIGLADPEDDHRRNRSGDEDECRLQLTHKWAESHDEDAEGDERQPDHSGNDRRALDPDKGGKHHLIDRSGDQPRRVDLETVLDL